MTHESDLSMGQLGDRRSVSANGYAQYPGPARISGTDQVYESMGIAQVKWIPDGSVGAGTEPLRRESTAFNLDFYAATIRYYYDGDCNWCGPDYGSGQAWTVSCMVFTQSLGQFGRARPRLCAPAHRRREVIKMIRLGGLSHRGGDSASGSARVFRP